MVLVLFTLLATSMAATSEHIDSEEIEELVLSSCRMGWHRITKEIQKAKTDMEKLENKWNLDMEKRSGKDDGYATIWRKHFAPAYRNNSDRFKIFTTVCEQMWDGNSDCKHKDSWDDKYDGRGAQFRKEFVEEVSNVIRDNLDNIKLERQAHGDL